MKVLYKTEISDTQTGLRGYPKCMIPMLLDCKGERYEYETEMLIVCARNTIPITEIPIETIYHVHNSGSHFNPIKDSFRIYSLFFSTFLKYLCSSLSAAAIDISMFAMLIHIVFTTNTKDIFVSTCIARIVSSLYNFLINRKFVFSSRNNIKLEIVKYYCLAAAQMLCSAALVSALTMVLPKLPSVNKIIVDTLLFFCSYYIQRKYVFRAAVHKEEQ